MISHLPKIILNIAFSSILSVSAQIKLSGTVLNRSGIPVPYVNIGIKGTQVGTISINKGIFNLTIPDSLKNTALTFSCVGYEDKDIPVLSFIVDGNNVVLDTKTIQLSEVIIKNKKPKVHQLGIIGRTPMTYMSPESYHTNDILEHARLIKIKEPSKILNANIFLLYGKSDSINIRLNFYALENDLPGERIFEKSIIKKFRVDKGWLTFDLRENAIYMDNDFVIAFEYLPPENSIQKEALSFGAKIGSAGSYLRRGSQGSWHKNNMGGSTIYVSAEY